MTISWLLLILTSHCTVANGFDSFPDDDLETRIDRVNEGELVFLAAPTERPVHHHDNRILITTSSMKDGWVTLGQCHYHLDPVGATEIVYHRQRIRKLRILSTERINKSRVEGPSVQLSGIGLNATICIQAESQALVPLEKGGYRLKNGPFMRRFLDGYYPMHVTMEVLYPAGQLLFASFRPSPGRSGRIEKSGGRIFWDGWFEGRLFTEFDFIEK